MRKNNNRILAYVVTLAILGVGMGACSKSASTANENTNAALSAMASTENNVVISQSQSESTVATSVSSSSEESSSRNLSDIYETEELDSSWDLNTATFINLNGSSAEVNGSDVLTDGSTIKISKGGTYVLSGKLSEGQIQIDADNTETVHLVLNEVEINNSSSSAIYAAGDGKLILSLAEGTVNKLTDGSNYVFADGRDEPDATLFVKNDLVINGNGELNIESNYGSAIKSKDTVTIISGTLNLNSVDNAIKGKDGVTVETGTINIEAVGKGITSEGAVYIYSGNVNITKSEEGIEGLSVDIYGGNVNIVATDDGMNARTNYDDSISEQEKEALSNQDQDGVWIRIAGGNIKVNAAGDALDSNGDLYIEGGYTMVSGPTSNGEGTLDYNGEAYITGGTYIGYGSSAMVQGFGTKSTQNSVNVYYDGTNNAGSEVVLTDSSGSVILSFTAEKDFSHLLISSADIVEGDVLKLLTAGNSQEFTVSSGDTTVGQGKGMMGDQGKGMKGAHGGGRGGAPGGDASKDFDRGFIKPERR